MTIETPITNYFGGNTNGDSDQKNNTFGASPVTVETPIKNFFGGNTNDDSDKKNSTSFSFKLPASTTITATATSTTNDSPVLSTPTETSTPVEQPADPAPVFGTLSGMSFAELAKTNSTNANTVTAANVNESPFGAASSGISFASLASAQNSNGSAAPFSRPPGNSEFIGLTTRDTFSNLMRPTTNTVNGTSNDHNASAGDNNENAANDDANYDPHYDPIIALPDVVEVSTGEENEVKLFSERAKLYRFDFDNKEVRKP